MERQQAELRRQIEFEKEIIKELKERNFGRPGGNSRNQIALFQFKGNSSYYGKAKSFSSQAIEFKKEFIKELKGETGEKFKKLNSAL